MRLLGFEITRAKAAVVPQGMQSVYGSDGWFPIIREPYAGAWQHNKEIRRESVLTYSAVYACATLIASDIAKVCLRLVEQDSDGIWTETDNPAFSPVLRKPNRYQTRIKFIEQWVISKLLHGNTYVLKERDGRGGGERTGNVRAMYVLDALRTKPLVAPDGEVYYDISSDNLSGILERTIVPASEIIHDTMVPLYHPLCGVSPITACGLAAYQGLAIQRNSTSFFENGSQPSGILTAPGNISNDDAARLKAHWEEKYTGQNAGKVAVVGSGLTYAPMTINAVDAQLIEQLRWSAETVCSCFHVPPYMIGVGPAPSYNNIEALNQQYYTQCLQSIIESIELCLDEGLGLTGGTQQYGTEFDLDDLLRMDTATKVKTAAEGLKGIFTPNEARKKFSLPKKPGGDAVYLQQQNFSIEALNKRDSQDDPFASKTPSAPAVPEHANDDIPDDQVDAAASLFAWELKSNLRLELPSIDTLAA